MNKQKIIKIGLNILLETGSVTVNAISERTSLDKSKLNALFSSGDKELLMDAVEYAGRIWVDKIKEDVSKEDNIESKLKVLAAGYALGSQDYPQSLSVYIDLWKNIKDNNDTYIKERLKKIYNFYIDEFRGIINEIGKFKVKEKEVKAFSLFMTVISDVLHIQSITLEDEVDFESFRFMIERITILYFTGGFNE